MPFHGRWHRMIQRELDGVLPAEQRGELERHRGGCEACARLSRDLHGLRAVLRADAQSLTSVGLAERIVAHVRRDGAPAAAADATGPWRRSAIAAGLALVLLGIVHGTTLPDEARAEDPPPAAGVPLDPQLRAILEARGTDRPATPWLDLFVPPARER